MKKTLVILAAGIGSRFVGGIKQLEKVGPGGEIIMDYSVHDAIKAGFNKIVFIIRKEIEEDFRNIIGNRIEKACEGLGIEFVYVFQSMDNIPEKLREGRVKPWGTGHAVLGCKGYINEPFAVINADDYYGKDGFVKASKLLDEGKYGLIGYVLKNTLSENGGVSRGLCTIENGKLTAINETRHIIGTPEGAEADGIYIDPETVVSMNFWCLPASFIGVLEEGFPEFLETNTDLLKGEYMLPAVVDSLIKKGVEVEALRTDAQWFGVTFMEDKPAVVESFRKLYEEKEYCNDLYSDLRK